ncbi:hypothetical protein J2X65_001671 [Ancylobacter sp. 3268]|uniref:GcrA family cell cycle regulator n=1 Tax=Ancylobacter sp. 3268 TaxID=2817752 RepID=UPI002859F25B|nr:GcrA family cell cycle regulator [Ancylobacter sp. 3268]MDR6952316.1 hypothetical protein [Ancylobacter sp. 3268]
MPGVTDRTPEEDGRLRVLLAEGLSYALIAAQLAMEGFPARTRCAVLGRANRLGLRQRPENLVDHAVTRGSAKRQPRLRLSTAKPKAGAAHKIVVAPPLEPVLPLAPDRPGIAMLAIREGQCRWPLWPDRGVTPPAEKRMCGAPVMRDGPYCPACRTLAFRPREARGCGDRHDERAAGRWNFA